MNKTLHASSLLTSPKNENPAMCAEDNKALKELLKDMKPYLEKASSDLLKPRKKIVAEIIKKAMQ